LRRLHRSTRPWIVLLAVALFTLIARGQEPRSSSVAPSTQKMAELLAKVARGLNPRASVYVMNKERVQLLREELGRAREPVLRTSLIGQLGHELLLAGETDEAIEKLKQFIELQGGRSAAPSADLLPARQTLALAYLRLAEQQNCIGRHTSESCLFPLQGGGVHTLQRSSRLAIAEYTSLLEGDPNNLSLRWLLNIAAMTVGEYPAGVSRPWLIPPESFRSDADLGRFPEIAGGLGLDLLTLAGGTVMEDFNGDGYLDLMVSSVGLQDPLRLFLNRQDGSFVERTREAGLSGETGGLNLAHADYNNDGHPDVLVLRGAWLEDNGAIPNSLLRGNGDGTFTDVTEEAGLLSFHPTQTAGWADFNNDGWIDLFIGNESSGNVVHPCELYQNGRDGTFRERAAAAGVDVIGFVKGVAWGDYDNDGWVDLYVSRLRQSNYLFHNNGPAQTDSGESGPVAFTDVAALAGVVDPVASFGTWFWDYDNDGWQDLLVLSFSAGSIGAVAALYLGLPAQAEPPRLYRNNRDGTFQDVTKEARLDKILLTMGANYGDLDNDGYLDAYFGTGTPDLVYLMPNRMVRNAAGRFFQDVTTSANVGHLQKGHGVSFGDLDNDGDQDIYSSIGGFYSGDLAYNVLFENPGHGNHWITLQLEGVKANRAAIGARIHLELDTASGPRSIYLTAGTGGSFGSSSLQQEIGLGSARKIRSIEIRWPGSGTRQRLEDVAVDQILRIREGDPKTQAVRLKRLDLSPPNAKPAPHAQ
jgi:hypothetical protein